VYVCTYVFIYTYTCTHTDIGPWLQSTLRKESASHTCTVIFVHTHIFVYILMCTYCDSNRHSKRRLHHTRIRTNIFAHKYIFVYTHMYTCCDSNRHLKRSLRHTRTRTNLYAYTHIFVYTHMYTYCDFNRHSMRSLHHTRTPTDIFAHTPIFVYSYTYIRTHTVTPIDIQEGVFEKPIYTYVHILWLHIYKCTNTVTPICTHTVTPYLSTYTYCDSYPRSGRSLHQTQVKVCIAHTYTYWHICAHTYIRIYTHVHIPWLQSTFRKESSKSLYIHMYTYCDSIYTSVQILWLQYVHILWLHIYVHTHTVTSIHIQEGVCITHM